MPKRTGDFDAWLNEELADPVEAANYLNAAMEQSREDFLTAVKDVIKAKESITTFAEKAGVTRESVHRSFSASGNPRLDTLLDSLGELGLRVWISAAGETGSLPEPEPEISQSKETQKNGIVITKQGYWLSTQVLQHGPFLNLADSTTVGPLSVPYPSFTWSGFTLPATLHTGVNPKHHA